MAGRFRHQRQPAHFCRHASHLSLCASVCYQDFPQAALPDELKDENPLGIWRLVNGAFTRDPL